MPGSSTSAFVDTYLFLITQLYFKNNFIEDFYYKKANTNSEQEWKKKNIKKCKGKKERESKKKKKICI